MILPNTATDIVHDKIIPFISHSYSASCVIFVLYYHFIKVRYRDMLLYKPSMQTIWFRSSSWNCTGTAKFCSASVSSYRAYIDGWTLSKRWISFLIANGTSSTKCFWVLIFIIVQPSLKQLSTKYNLHKI